MDIFVTILLLLVVIIIVIMIISFFAKITTDNYMKDIMMPIQGKSFGLKDCPKGCIRGTCNGKGDGNKSCKYDFQCDYCKDKKTGMFYVDFDNDREILPLYDESKNMNKDDIHKLNDMINKNNDYIKKLDEKIEMINNS